MKTAMNPMSMRTKRYTAEGETFEFDCYSSSTRNGFSHHADMYDGNGELIAEADAYYYNRTWERCEFDSVCLQAVRKVEAAEKKRLRAEWMEARGIKRMTAKYREAYEAEAPSSDLLRKLETLQFVIRACPQQYDHRAGARENSVLGDTPLNVCRVETTEGHEVYKLISASGDWCEYDNATHSFVG